MYADQDSLGAAPWSTFASKAGIQDIKAFSRCMSDTSSFPKIQAGIEAGRNIRLSGTPTVILNGWRYGIAPVDSELSRAVNDILAKRKPYNGFPLDALGPGSN
jgi:hypothetical protein